MESETRRVIAYATPEVEADEVLYHGKEKWVGKMRYLYCTGCARYVRNMDWEKHVYHATV